MPTVTKRFPATFVLTPAEWEHLTYAAHYPDRTIEARITAGKVVFTSDNGVGAVIVGREDIPAVLALLNAALPKTHRLKITENVVDDLRHAAHDVDQVGDDYDVGSETWVLSRRIRRWATALAAQLPPQ